MASTKPTYKEDFINCCDGVVGNGDGDNKEGQNILAATTCAHSHHPTNSHALLLPLLLMLLLLLLIFLPTTILSQILCS